LTSENEQIKETAKELVRHYTQRAKKKLKHKKYVLHPSEFVHFLRIAIQHPEEVFSPSLYIDAAFRLDWFSKKKGKIVKQKKPMPFQLLFDRVNNEYLRRVDMGLQVNKPEDVILANVVSSMQHIKRIHRKEALHSISGAKIYKLFCSGVISPYYIAGINTLYLWFINNVKQKEEVGVVRTARRRVLDLDLFKQIKETIEKGG